MLPCLESCLIPTVSRFPTDGRPGGRHLGSPPKTPIGVTFLDFLEGKPALFAVSTRVCRTLLQHPLHWALSESRSDFGTFVSKLEQVLGCQDIISIIPFLHILKFCFVLPFFFFFFLKGRLQSARDVLGSNPKGKLSGLYILYTVLSLLDTAAPGIWLW